MMRVLNGEGLAGSFSGSDLPRDGADARELEGGKGRFFRDDLDHKRLLARLEQGITDFKVRLYLYCSISRLVWLKAIKVRRWSGKSFANEWLEGELVEQ
jgi:hypothetical protein